MIAIDEYLKNIFSDFQNYIEEKHELCFLKSVNYDAGHCPDYRDIHLQQCYLLRYAYGYSFEYLQMYWHLFSRLHGQNEMEILSLGCGSMIDYWSLVKANRLARQNNGMGINKFVCTGVDCVEWSYQMQARTTEGIVLDEVEFIRKDIIQYLRELPVLTPDVYIFPKSINEFSVKQAWLMGRLFAEKIPTDKSVYFLFSLRSDDFHRGQDIERTTQIYQAMVEAGFKTLDSIHEIYSIPNGENLKIYDSSDGLFRNARHLMDEIKAYLSVLHTRCSLYRENGYSCERDCEERLTRSPILYQKYALWQLFEFRKEN